MAVIVKTVLRDEKGQIVHVVEQPLDSHHLGGQVDCPLCHRTAETMAQRGFDAAVEFYAGRGQLLPDAEATPGE